MSNNIDNRNEADDPGADFDSEVALRLRPLTTTPVPDAPDVWAMIDDAATADGGVIDIDTRSDGQDRSWVRPLVIAAALAVLVVGAVTLLPDQGQQLDTPATPDPTPDSGPAPDGTSESQRSDEAPKFPDGVEIGPDRSTMSSVPADGSFLIIYDAGAVAVAADGEVFGHYPGETPDFLLAGQPTTTEDGSSPDACRSLVSPTGTVYLCSDDVGPTVEMVDDAGQRRPLASFPDPGDGGTVPGAFTEGFIAPVIYRGKPMLIQWRQDLSAASSGCSEKLITLIADQASWSTTRPRGGEIRHLDGQSWWHEASEIPFHQSVAVGWTTDGDEAYVWEYNGTCQREVSVVNGLYAYELSGSSRLVFELDDNVRDVIQVRYPDIETIGQADPVDMAATYPGTWESWTGPLEVTDADLPSLLTDPFYGTDAELMLVFAQTELGMANPTASITAVDPSSWILVDGDLAVRFTPNTWFLSTEPSAANLDEWSIERADTFTPDYDDYLSAEVRPDPAGDGTWTARFGAPSRDAELTVSYVIGETALEPEITYPDDESAEIRFTLDTEPTEPAQLTILWTRANRVVGYQRTVLPPGELAAG